MSWRSNWHRFSRWASGAEALHRRAKHAELESKLERIRHLCTAELDAGGKPHTDHGVLHTYEVDYCVTCAVLKVLDE